jgi:hypothetical protein
MTGSNERSKEIKRKFWIIHIPIFLFRPKVKEVIEECFEVVLWNVLPIVQKLFHS